nr:unnamed protein product [Callosobruchus analis]
MSEGKDEVDAAYAMKSWRSILGASMHNLRHKKLNSNARSARNTIVCRVVLKHIVVPDNYIFS